MNDDGSKTIRNKYISSWEEIMNAESWGTDSLDGFYKYYDIPVKFLPGVQPVTIYYDYLNKDMIKVESVSTSESLTPVYIGTTVKWRDNVTVSTKKISSKNYSLIGCYVEPTGNKSTIEGVTSWYPENKTPDEILAVVKAASAVMPWGGMKIHIVYKEVTEYTNYLYYTCGDISKYVTDLTTLKVDEKLSWEVEAKANPPSGVFGQAEYELQGYMITSADDKIFIRGRNKSTTTTEADLLKDTTIVEEGGVRVYLIYTSSGPHPPTPPPVTPPVTPVPKPTIPPLVVPEGGQESKSLDSFKTAGVIRADLRGAERFIVLQGVPTTESLYSQVQGTQYNIGYTLAKKVNIISYPIKVSKTYHLSWTDAKTKTKVYKKDVTVDQTVSVERACAYWVIEYFDCFTLDKATIYNGALPGGVTTMYPSGTYYSPPPLVINHSSNENDHIIPPSQYKDGIILDAVTLPQGNGVMPTIDKEDFTYEANILTDEIAVKNDYLEFNGYIIMDNSLYEKETPDLTNLNILGIKAALSNKDAMYKPDQVIPALTLNDIYYSSGTLTYKNHPSAVNSSGSYYNVPIDGLNNVIVHTPVICDASITTENASTGITSNDSYVQVINVDKSCVQLVIDPDSTLSDFSVDISNYGKHLSIPGYYTRDFAWGIRGVNVSYIALKNGIYRNEVKFPFDVFIRKESGDEYVAKNTWIRFGHSTPTFHLPMWVDEGTYSVSFRTIAVNGVNTDSQLSMTQTYANTDRSNYVATDTVRVQVSGRLYGLAIYDVTDYPTWETVFRKQEGSAVLKINEEYPSGVTKTKYNAGYAYDYTVGTSDQYGIPTGRLDQFTLPLVNGSHPKYANVGVLKTGYAVKFKLTATGNAYSSGDSVLIKPKFYYVDADGKNRREVDVYYTENFNGKNHNYVKMGSTLDLTNIKTYRCGDSFLGIPTNLLKIMANIAKITYNSYLWKTTDLFTYTSIRMRAPLMTYVNGGYLQDIKSGTQYSAIKAAGVSVTDIVRRMQTYYGEYFFPADIKVVEKAYDVYGYASKYGIGDNESFWLTGGYIIVNFDIVTEDENGNKNVSYINSVNAANGYCSMWSMENPVPNKVSYNGKKEKSTVFNFLPGDFMVYYTDNSLKMIMNRT